MEKRIIILPTNSPTTDQIGDSIKIPLWVECYDSIFTYCETMVKSTTLTDPFESLSLQLGKKYYDQEYHLE